MVKNINGIDSGLRTKPLDADALKTSERSAAVKNAEVKEIQEDERVKGGLRSKKDERAKGDVLRGRDEKVRKDVYGSVIASSKDGDTVSAKKDALEALETGMVFKKEEDKKAVRTDESLAGVSQDQLETMYLQGDIDKVKYDREVQRREELKGEDTSPAKTDEKTSDQKVLKQENENEALKSEEEKREEKAEEAAKGDASERIKEAQKENEAFSKEMGGLNAEKEDKKLKAEALEEGIANDRAAIVEDIFTGEKK